MRTFIKAQTSSLIATLADFSTTVVLVEAFKANIVAATMLGAVAGAFTNFFMNRHWSFQKGSGRLTHQGLKYALVWTGSLLLNTAGVYLLAVQGGLNYIVSKVAVALVVGIAFNYTLQRQYVFAADEKALSK